jgi:hypothetical protein
MFFDVPFAFISGLRIRLDIETNSTEGVIRLLKVAFSRLEVPSHETMNSDKSPFSSLDR